MVKVNVPKRVTLPNGRTFVAHYKRIPRSELPDNIVMWRNYAQKFMLLQDVVGIDKEVVVFLTL